MTMPKRIQLRRTRGWRMPADTVKCARPGVLGNPFAHDVPAVAVEAFEHWLDQRPFVVDGLRIVANAGKVRRRETLAAIKLAAGKDCACWCKLESSCHAEVILRRANARS